MVSDKRGRGRWLRVGFLTLTTFAPVLTRVGPRLFGQAKKKDPLLVEESKPYSVFDDLSSISQEKLQVLGAALIDAVEDVRKRQRQAARERAEQTRERESAVEQEGRESGPGLAQELAERSSRFTHNLVGRGSQVTHDLTEMGSRLTQEIADRGAQLADRGTQLKRELTRKGKQADRSRRGRERRKEKGRSSRFGKDQLPHDYQGLYEMYVQGLAEHKKAFWASLGFGVGLAAAGIITYRIVRHRQREQEAELLEELEQGPHIELPASQTRPDEVRSPLETMLVPPADAAFLGLVSNKLYYPIETPFEELPVPDNTPMDVVYFASEEDAQSEGYVAALP